QEAFGEDHGGDRQRHIDDHRTQHVGNDVMADVRNRADAGGARGLDEFLLLDRQRLAANDPRHGEPFHRTDGDEKQEEVLVEHHHQDDDKEDEGQRIENIDKAYHYFIEATAEKARDGAIG